MGDQGCEAPGAPDLRAQIHLLQGAIDMLLHDPAMDDAGMVEHLAEAQRLLPDIIAGFRTSPSRSDAPDLYRHFDTVIRVLYEAQQRLPSTIPASGWQRRHAFRTAALYYEAVARESLNEKERRLAKDIADDASLLSCADRNANDPAVDVDAILGRIRERQRRLTALGHSRHLLTRSSGASFVN